MQFVFLSTVFVSALCFTLLLKGLKLFHLIEWHPVHWTEKLGIQQDAHFMMKWGIVFIVLFLLFALVYYIAQFVQMPMIFAVVLGIILAVLFENYQQPGVQLKQLSVPFIVITVLACYFIASTARFHKENSTLRQSK